MKVASILATQMAIPCKIACVFPLQFKAGEHAPTGLRLLPDLSDRFPVSRCQAGAA